MKEDQEHENEIREEKREIMKIEKIKGINRLKEEKCLEKQKKIKGSSQRKDNEERMRLMKNTMFYFFFLFCFDF